MALSDQDKAAFTLAMTGPGGLALSGQAPQFTQALSDSGRRAARAGAFGIGGQLVDAPAPPPRPDGVTIRDEPQTLQPMATPDVEVQPSPTLDPRYEKFKAAVTGGAGGGGLGGLRGEWMGARKGLLAGFDQQKDLEGRKGVAQADRIDRTADLQVLDAAKRQRDAELQAQQDAKAAERHQRFLDRNEELADEIGKQKVDPSRLFRDMSTAQKATSVLGSVLGGFAAGLKGGPNEFLQRFDNKVSEDIAAQQNEIDNKKSSLKAREGVFGQMLAETGDRRLAAMQTRNMMYEAAKQELTAEADRLGIPEINVNADIARQAIQGQQDKLKEQFAHESYATAQQQAAAAAAAQRAAEEKAWQRQMDVVKFGLEKDKLEIDRQKAGGDQRKEDAAAVSTAAERMGKDEIVKNRELVNSLNRKVGADGNVVGLGLRATLASKIANSAPGSLAILGRAALSDEERIAQQEFEQARLLYQTKVTGSGGSDEQMAAISQAFKGAGTMAEKKHAIELLKAELDRREGLAQVGLSDDQKALFRQRMLREGQAEMPNSVKVKAR